MTEETWQFPKLITEPLDQSCALAQTLEEHRKRKDLLLSRKLVVVDIGSFS